eukprot:11852-Heterococcus_DN1.PRE.1
MVEGLKQQACTSSRVTQRSTRRRKQAQRGAVEDLAVFLLSCVCVPQGQSELSACFSSFLLQTRSFVNPAHQTEQKTKPVCCLCYESMGDSARKRTMPASGAGNTSFQAEVSASRLAELEKLLLQKISERGSSLATALKRVLKQYDLNGSGELEMPELERAFQVQCSSWPNRLLQALVEH